MSEQPDSTARHTAPDEEQSDWRAAHGHVRTEGETNVDDALGGTEDPR